MKSTYMFIVFVCVFVCPCEGWKPIAGVFLGLSSLQSKQTEENLDDTEFGNRFFLDKNQKQDT